MPALERLDMTLDISRTAALEEKRAARWTPEGYLLTVILSVAAALGAVSFLWG